MKEYYSTEQRCKYRWGADVVEWGYLHGGPKFVKFSFRPYDDLAAGRWAYLAWFGCCIRIIPGPNKLFGMLMRALSSRTDLSFDAHCQIWSGVQDASDIPMNFMIETLLLRGIHGVSVPLLLHCASATDTWHLGIYHTIASLSPTQLCVQTVGVPLLRRILTTDLTDARKNGGYAGFLRHSCDILSKVLVNNESDNNNHTYFRPTLEGILSFASKPREVSAILGEALILLCMYPPVNRLDLKYLVVNRGASVHIRNDNALQWAVLRRDAPTVDFLVCHGARVSGLDFSESPSMASAVAKASAYSRRKTLLHWLFARNQHQRERRALGSSLAKVVSMAGVRRSQRIARAERSKRDRNDTPA